MKCKVISLENTEVKEIDLPSQFNEPISPALIARAVVTDQANTRQAYGAHPEAGMRGSTKVSRRRHQYRGSYGYGISRVPRKILSRRGTQFNWEGAQAPGTKGGRRAHPPKAEKIWGLKLNKKERKKAIRSALAATMSPEFVGAKHVIPKTFPFIVDNAIEKSEKTKDVKNTLQKLQLSDELVRVSKKQVRAGRGTMRGRKYKKKVGPLLVVSNEASVEKAARNIPGVQIVRVEELTPVMLAPGREPGRLTLFTEAAIQKMQKEALFT